LGMYLWVSSLLLHEKMSDYYAILEVPKSASEQDIKKA